MAEASVGPLRINKHLQDLGTGSAFLGSSWGRIRILLIRIHDTGIDTG